MFPKLTTTCETCYAVIPAQAGIQLVKSYRVADKAILRVLSHCVELFQLPGFRPTPE